MNNTRWSAEEDAIIREHYSSNPDTEYIQSLLPGRTIAAVKLHGAKLGLNKARRVLPNTAFRLVEETPVSMYWLGLLLADGHFTPSGRVSLNLSDPDFNHVQKFAEFVGGNIQTYKPVKLSGYGTANNNHNVAVMDSVLIKSLMEKYGIVSNKTLKPPDFACVLDDELFLCLLVGFIDGDGSINRLKNRNDCQIAIKKHGSWVDTLTYIASRLGTIVGTELATANINSAGFSTLHIANTVAVRRLRETITKYSLPFLARK